MTDTETQPTLSSIASVYGESDEEFVPDDPKDIVSPKGPESESKPGQSRGESPENNERSEESSSDESESVGSSQSGLRAHGLVSYGGAEDEEGGSESEASNEDMSTDQMRSGLQTPLLDEVTHHSSNQDSPEERYSPRDDERGTPPEVPDYYNTDMSKPGALAAILTRIKPDEIILPPVSKGRCSKELQRNIENYHRQMKAGRDLTKEITKRKDFRNPTIYEKLVEFLKIDEKGTNIPKSFFDPRGFPKSAYYDQLAKAQNELHKKEQQVVSTTTAPASGTVHKPTVSVVSKPTTSGVVDLSKKSAPSTHVATAEPRSSKWDIPPSTGFPAHSGPRLPPPLLTTIPAIGPLKKPRLDDGK